jgi:uncharacterized membrane protein YuzA (DUF378 family)
MSHKGGIVGAVSCILLIVGGLNWGLIGIGGFVGSDWNIVHMLLGAWPQVEWIVYILVGISAVMSLMYCKKDHITSGTM